MGIPVVMPDRNYPDGSCPAEHMVFQAIEQGDVEKIKLLIKDNKTLLTAIGKFSDAIVRAQDKQEAIEATLVEMAVLHGKINILSTLIELGAAKESKNGYRFHSGSLSSTPE